MVTGGYLGYGGYRWLRLVMVGNGWLWVVTGGYGWLRGLKGSHEVTGGNLNLTLALMCCAVFFYCIWLHFDCIWLYFGCTLVIIVEGGCLPP